MINALRCKISMLLNTPELKVLILVSSGGLSVKADLEMLNWARVV